MNCKEIHTRKDESSKKLISKEQQVIDNKKITVETYKDKGKEVKVYSGNVSNKEDIINELDAVAEEKVMNESTEGIMSYAVAASSGDPTGPNEGWAPIRTYSKTGKSSANQYARVSEKIKYRGYMKGLTFKLKVYGGSTKGYWYGTNPHNAKKIILRQTYEIDTIGGSVNWPAGISLSSSTKKYTWVSDSYPNTWVCEAEHESLTVKNAVAVMSVTVSDGADVYIGSKCYKARTSISKSLRQVYYGSNY